jgi:RNase P protein component
MKVAELYTTDLHEDGAEVEILDGSGKKTGLFLKVMGVDSAVFRNHSKRQQRAYIDALRNDEDFDDEEFVVDALVSATIGWRGTNEKFTKELCEELYRKAPYVRDQVDKFVADRANFIPAKPKK